MIDRRQHDEEREPQAQAPDDQLLLDRQQRFDGGGAQFLAQVGLGVLRHDELLIVVHFRLCVFSWPAAA